MDWDTQGKLPAAAVYAARLAPNLEENHHRHSYSTALQEATMSSGSRPMSGLQKQVLALYRQVLRASKSKPVEMRDEMR